MKAKLTRGNETKTLKIGEHVFPVVLDPSMPPDEFRLVNVGATRSGKLAKTMEVINKLNAGYIFYERP